MPLTGPAGILWTASDDHTKLGRDDIQPLAGIFADHMPITATIACRTLGRDNFFDTGQVFGQRAPVSVPLSGLRLGRINRLVFRMHCCNCRLDVLQRQLILVWIRLLRLGAEHRALEVCHQLFQPDDPLLLALYHCVTLSQSRITLGCALFCGPQKRLQGRDICGKIGGEAHGPDLPETAALHRPKRPSDSLCRSRW